MRYTVVLTPEPDGSAVNVAVPAMPGIHTWGRTEDEAVDSAREAIVLHLEGYTERGKPAPRDRRPLVDRARVHRLRRRAAGRRLVMVEVGQPVGTPPLVAHGHRLDSRVGG